MGRLKHPSVALSEMPWGGRHECRMCAERSCSAVKYACVLTSVLTWSWGSPLSCHHSGVGGGARLGPRTPTCPGYPVLCVLFSQEPAKSGSSFEHTAPFVLCTEVLQGPRLFPGTASGSECRLLANAFAQAICWYPLFPHHLSLSCILVSRS